MVAGGVYKTAPQLVRVVGSDIIPEGGSITTEARSGNGGCDYYAEHDERTDERVLRFTLNALGMPNPGMAYVERHAHDLLRLYADHDKPLAINVSGESAEDLLSLVERALTLGFKVITMNGACPNGLTQNGSRIPLLCHDVDALWNFFHRLEKAVGKTDALLWWKLSNGMHRKLLEHNRLCVATSQSAHGMIIGNTIGNTFRSRPDGSPAIQTENGLTRGGLAGPEIMDGALADTAYCADRMPDHKVVVGAGGISSAKDALKFFGAGATLVQVHSAFRHAEEDPRFITNLLEALADLLEAQA